MMDPAKCSFCNKPQTHVKKLIAGPNVYICDECVDICFDVIREDGPACGICRRSASVPDSLMVDDALICQRCLESMRPYFSGNQKPPSYWIEQANESLVTARLLTEHKRFAVAAFHAHQCAEAALRAVLLEHGGGMGMDGHSLVDLLANNDIVPDLYLAARTLDVYFIPISVREILPRSGWSSTASRARR